METEKPRAKGTCPKKQAAHAAQAKFAVPSERREIPSFSHQRNKSRALPSYGGRQTGRSNRRSKYFGNKADAPDKDPWPSVPDGARNGHGGFSWLHKGKGGQSVPAAEMSPGGVHMQCWQDQPHFLTHWRPAELRAISSQGCISNSTRSIGGGGRQRSQKGSSPVLL